MVFNIKEILQNGYNGSFAHIYIAKNDTLDTHVRYDSVSNRLGNKICAKKTKVEELSKEEIDTIGRYVDSLVNKSHIL